MPPQYPWTGFYGPVGRRPSCFEGPRICARRLHEHISKPRNPRIIADYPLQPHPQEGCMTRKPLHLWTGLPGIGLWTRTGPMAHLTPAEPRTLADSHHDIADQMEEAN